MTGIRRAILRTAAARKLISRRAASDLRQTPPLRILWGATTAPSAARDWSQLKQDLQSIDRRDSGAYQRLLGEYTHPFLPRFSLVFDHVPPDVSSGLARVRAIVPWIETRLPDSFLKSGTSRVAVGDFVTRTAAAFLNARKLDRRLVHAADGTAGAKAGSLIIDRPGPEILPRTSAVVGSKSVSTSIELRLGAALPISGRGIPADEAWQLLGVDLVALIEEAMLWPAERRKLLNRHVFSSIRQARLRSQLAEHNLVAFVADGPILPRSSSGVAAASAAAGPAPSKMAPGTAPFRSPDELAVTLYGAMREPIRGMGIPRGVTLLTGGSRQARSTLLEAIQRGVCNHVWTDGRAHVATDPTAVKICAEPGRNVSNLDLSPLLSALPPDGSSSSSNPTAHPPNPHDFSTSSATESISMAANIQEALEVGCKTLLIDEDSAAVDLLLARDPRVQALLGSQPLIPFVEKARALFREHGASTLLAVQAARSGDWLSVADTVVVLDDCGGGDGGEGGDDNVFQPRVVTKEAREIAESRQSPRLSSSSTPPEQSSSSSSWGDLPRRTFQLDFSGLGKPIARSSQGDIAIKHTDTRHHPLNRQQAWPIVGLDKLEAVVEKGQARMIATMMTWLEQNTKEKALPLNALLDQIAAWTNLEASLPLEALDGDRVAVRRHEIAAALARLPAGLTVESSLPESERELHGESDEFYEDDLSSTAPPPASAPTEDSPMTGSIDEESSLEGDLYREWHEDFDDDPLQQEDDSFRREDDSFPQADDPPPSPPERP